MHKERTEPRGQDKDTQNIWHLFTILSCRDTLTRGLSETSKSPRTIHRHEGKGQKNKRGNSPTKHQECGGLSAALSVRFRESTNFGQPFFLDVQNTVFRASENKTNYLPSKLIATQKRPSFRMVFFVLASPYFPRQLPAKYLQRCVA